MSSNMGNMWRCNGCETLNAAENNFCEICGTPKPAEPVIKTSYETVRPEYDTTPLQYETYQPEPVTLPGQHDPYRTAAEAAPPVRKLSAGRIAVRVVLIAANIVMAFLNYKIIIEVF